MEPSFVIDTHALPEGIGAWTFPVPPEWCAHHLAAGGVEPTDAPGTVEVEVTKTGDGYLVRGRVRVFLTGTCVRCLGPTPISVDAKFDALYVHGIVDATPRKAREADEDGFEAVAEEPDVEHFQGYEIGIDAYVRDTILLEVPMNPRCPVPCPLGSPGSPC